MPYKDIIVHVDDSPQADARVRAALAMAQAHGAHLTGVYAIPRPYIPSYAEVHLSPEVLEAQIKWAEAAAKRAEAMFHDITTQPGAGSVEWRVENGDVGSILAFQCRYADLTIVGQPDPGEALFPGDRDMSDRLILTAGRPILVLPHTHSGDITAKRVLLAWDEGPLASRAVHDALPMLKMAEKVVVMVVNPDKDDVASRDPGADIAAHLARHGVKVEADHVTTDEIDVGNMLLSRAAGMGADMMVMGAYGKARWSELLLGGVTHRVLSNQTLPVMMSH